MQFQARPYRAIRLTVEQAQYVWENSHEPTAFTRPLYLAQLADEVEWWGVDRSGKLLAAWPLVRPQRGGSILPPRFTYYVGPLFVRELCEDPFSNTAWKSYTETFRTLIEAVTEAHPKFSFSLSPGLVDVRVLSWWNFDNPTEKGFHITPRYTARIDLQRHSDDGSLLNSMSRGRWREIRQWADSPPYCCADVAAERLLEIHDQTLKRTSGEISPERHKALLRMIALIRSGAGQILGYAPRRVDAIEGIVALLHGPHTTDFVFLGVSDDFARTRLSSWMQWHSILQAKAAGSRWFDMNGANSPRRAAHKHSYGARTDLYFDCHFERT